MTSEKIPNLVLTRTFLLKILPLKKILEFHWKTERRLQNLYKKENFKPEIKSMIKNLQDELYQLENKQPKGAKLGANIR